MNSEKLQKDTNSGLTLSYVIGHTAYAEGCQLTLASFS